MRRSAPLFLVAMAILAAAHSTTARAEHAAPAEPLPHHYSPHADVRHGGALGESYHYHRQPHAAAAITPPAGWHRYGFAVDTYRWGWFGATRYYPRVLWHRGYNGEQCRWAYRKGY